MNLSNWIFVFIFLL